MKKYFIETNSFMGWVAEQPIEWDAEYAALQRRLMENPESGKVMKGCGGLRKVRLSDPKRGKGKRGGARVIYLHIPEADCVCLIDAYGKGEKEDLSAQERAVLAQLADIARQKVLAAGGRVKTDPDEGREGTRRKSGPACSSG
jgi:hypothetical protein